MARGSYQLWIVLCGMAGYGDVGEEDTLDAVVNTGEAIRPPASERSFPTGTITGQIVSPPSGDREES